MRCVVESITKRDIADRAAGLRWIKDFCTAASQTLFPHPSAKGRAGTLEDLMQVAHRDARRNRGTTRRQVRVAQVRSGVDLDTS